MGAIADAFVAYAQPLLDQTDGSEEQLNKAFALSQLCFNLSVLSEGDREQSLREMQANLQMDDEELDDEARQDRRENPGQHRGEVRPVVELEELRRHRGGEGAEHTLGEVDDPVGPVDEHDPDGEERVQQPDDETLEVDPEGDGRGDRDGGEHDLPEKHDRHEAETEGGHAPERAPCVQPLPSPG
jgi:hypothetical protein